MAGSDTTDTGRGPIRADEVYPLRDACRRLGWRAHALRQAKLKGFRTILFGRERYVLGRDVLAFFEKLADESPNGEGGAE